MDETEDLRRDQEQRAAEEARRAREAESEHEER